MLDDIIGGVTKEALNSSHGVRLCVCVQFFFFFSLSSPRRICIIYYCTVNDIAAAFLKCICRTMAQSAPNGFFSSVRYRKEEKRKK